MSRKIIVSVLLILSAGMLALTILFYSRSDRVAPQIQFIPDEVSYSPGDDEAKLLEGVTASDNKDGDLTEKIFIEKIVPAKGGLTATVTYVVVDSSNNVGKAVRVVNYRGNDNKEADETDALSVFGGDAGKPAYSKGVKSTEGSDTGATEGADKEDSDEEPEGESEGESESQSETEDRTPREDGRPTTFLKTKKATVDFGAEIDYMSYIDEIVDDKDGLEIWRSISIDGREGAEERGTHTLSFYVTDSDGNVSDIVEMELTVK